MSYNYEMALLCLFFLAKPLSDKLLFVIGICNDHFIFKHKFKLIYFDFISVSLILAYGSFPYLKQYKSD